MRQGQQNHYNNNNNKRMRGRNNRKGPNPLTRSYESNGGDVKIRGTALHIAEKYVQLARDAQSSGDRVASENYFQHAEHYYRMVAAAQAQMPQPQPVFRSDGDNEEDDDRADGGNGFAGNQGGYQGGNPGYQGGGNQGGGNQGQGGNQNYQGGEQPSFGGSDPQPFLNGGGNMQGEDEGARQSRSPNENRPDNRGQEYPRYDNNRGDQQNNGGQQNRERGDFRGRRRRPFRERYQDQSGPRNDATAVEPGPAPADGPSGEE